MLPHLVIDGGLKLNEDEAESNHRQNTEEGGQEYGQPHVRLVQRVSCSAWRLDLQSERQTPPFHTVHVNELSTYSPTKGKAEVKMRNMPLLYMVKVMAK